MFVAKLEHERKKSLFIVAITRAENFSFSISSESFQEIKLDVEKGLK